MANKPEPKQSSKATSKHQREKAIKAASKARADMEQKGTADFLADWVFKYKIVPQFIVEFLSAYLVDQNPEHVLDPWAGFGSLLTPLVKAHAIPEAVGINPHRESLTNAENLSEGLPIKWIYGEPEKVLDKLGKFDLIVSAPPDSLTPMSETFETKEGPVKVRGSAACVRVQGNPQARAFGKRNHRTARGHCSRVQPDRIKCRLPKQKPVIGSLRRSPGS